MLDIIEYTFEYLKISLYIPLLISFRYCTFQRNEPCSLPAIVEMIAAFMKKTPDEVALATAFNALKLFGLS